jgi:RHS repeat-associated protein
VGATGCNPTPSFFTGKERDQESQLDDFGARYYSSHWGQWMSPDWSASPASVPYATMANPQSLNLYAYVGDDPVDGEDPDGHAAYAIGNQGEYTNSDNSQPGLAMETQLLSLLVHIIRQTSIGESLTN